MANGVFDGGAATDGTPAAGDDFIVLCAARLRAREGRGHLLIRAVAAARRSEPRIRGLVAGDGPERPALERLGRGKRRGTAGRAP